MLATVTRLKCSLDAVIPTAFAGGKGMLNWIPTQAFSNVRFYAIESNEDLEEQFHWIFGPFVVEDYAAELESMLHDVVFGDKSSYVCSTVRIEVLRMRGAMLQIQQIFIRPCLQRHGVLGRLLLYLARHVTTEQLSVQHCLPESSAAINKYYGGDDARIFTRDAGGGNGLITFTMNDPKAFQEQFASLEDREYPWYADLNGRGMSDVEWEWAQFARFVHEEGLDDSLVDCQFKTGYGDVSRGDFLGQCDDFKRELMDTCDECEQYLEWDNDDADERFHERYNSAIAFMERLYKAKLIPAPALFPLND